MKLTHSAYARWRQKCICFEAALHDLRSAIFLLDETIDLDDRFEVALRVLYPEYKHASHPH